MTAILDHRRDMEAWFLNDIDRHVQESLRQSHRKREQRDFAPAATIAREALQGFEVECQDAWRSTRWQRRIGWLRQKLGSKRPVPDAGRD